MTCSARESVSQWNRFKLKPLTHFFNMSIYKRLEELQITLPAVATPAAAYVPFAQTGNLVFLSGHISKKNGQAWTGTKEDKENTE